MKALNYLQNLGQKLIGDKSKHVSENTILGRNLGFRELREISGLLNFAPEEKVQIIWSYNGFFAPKNNIMVGVTNRQIFRLEYQMINRTPLSTIALDEEGEPKVRAIHNEINEWHKVQCELIDGGMVNYGILSRRACDYFCDYLRNHKNPDFSPSSPIPIPKAKANDPLLKLYQRDKPIVLREDPPLSPPPLKMGESPAVVLKWQSLLSSPSPKDIL